jgi:putative monooxygenase
MEHIFSGKSNLAADAPVGLSVQSFVSRACGAIGFSTGIVIFAPGAVWPYHAHDVSEAMTILEGRAGVSVENRTYELTALDSIHFPAGVAHTIDSGADPLKVHIAHASAEPAATFVSGPFPECDHPPERIHRFAAADAYSLSGGASFYDLFARRFGSVGICGGYARFQPGSSLPCHTHDYDESITIVAGEAVCLAQGNRYLVSGCDTVFVPKGRPHRFLNESTSPMAMIWVYAGDEPDRTVVDAGYCSGALVWPH